MIAFVMWISRGSLVPKDYEQKEYWTWKPAGEKPLLLRLFSRRRRWGDSPEEGNSVNDTKDTHLSMDADSTAASATPLAGAAASGASADAHSRSVGSHSIASRAESTAGDRVSEIRRPPTPGPFRSLY